jgi:hypothetical protein
VPGAKEDLAATRIEIGACACDTCHDPVLIAAIQPCCHGPAAPINAGQRLVSLAKVRFVK